MTATDQHRFPIILLAAVFILSLLAAVYTELYYLIAIPFIFLAVCAGWQHFYIAFFILLCSLPFSAEVRIAASFGTDFPDELLMLLVAFLFLCYWIYEPGIITNQMIGHPLSLVLLTCMGWTLVTVLFSSQSFISLKFLLAKSWYLGAFVISPLIVFRSRARIRSSLVLLTGSMVVVMLITMARHYFYDFSFASINLALRPFFRNHVNYSAMLVCMAPVLLVMYKLNDRIRNRRLVAFVFVLLIIALFFSYSRGAWLALFTGFAGWWLIKRKLLLASYFIVIAAVLTSLCWISSGDRYLRYAPDYRTTIFHEDFRQHLEATYAMKDVSTAERFYRWIAGARMVEDKSLTGFGPGSFYYNYKPYAIPVYKTWVSDNPEHSTVHNYFLLLLIEQGIPAFLFFLLLAGTMLYYAQMLYHRVADVFYRYIAIAVGSVVVMLLTVNFLSDLIETDKIGSIFFLCLSLLITTDINTRKALQFPPHIQGIP